MKKDPKVQLLQPLLTKKIWLRNIVSKRLNNALHSSHFHPFSLWQGKPHSQAFQHNKRGFVNCIGAMERSTQKQTHTSAYTCTHNAYHSTLHNLMPKNPVHTYIFESFITLKSSLNTQPTCCVFDEHTMFGYNFKIPKFLWKSKFSDWRMLTNAHAWHCK